jgi:hypothetical protein
VSFHDEMREEQADIETRRSATGGPKLQSIKLKEGVNRVRLIPFYKDFAKGEFGKPFRKATTCFGVGPNKKVVVTRAQYGLTPCPMTDHIEKLQKKKDKVSAEELKRLKPKLQYRMFIIDREDEETGYKVFQISDWFMKHLLPLLADPEYGNITDPDDGRDIKIHYVPGEKTANGIPTYSFQAAANPSPLLSPAIADLKDEILGVDLFERHRIGFPNTAEYVEACLAGKDKEFKGARVTRPDGSEAKWNEDEEGDISTSSQPVKAAAAAPVQPDPEAPSALDDEEAQALKALHEAQAKVAAAKQAKPQGQSVADRIKAGLK